MSRQSLLIRHHELSFPAPVDEALPKDVLATILNNLSSYGYGLTMEGYRALEHTPRDVVAPWWAEVEAALRSITGDDRDMEAHVVYKNFPAEVLAMSEADYWIRQILMYWGLPNELFTTEPEPRDPAPAIEKSARILRPASEASLPRIRGELLAQPARWTDGQWADLVSVCEADPDAVELDAVPFKENMVQLAAWLLAQDRPARVSTATDVLRLAVALSDGDIDAIGQSKLKTFSRAERRFLAGMLERTKHLEADLARRPEPFKRLLRALRPGDYADRFPRVVEAYDQLYRGELPPAWAARVEAAFASGDEEALTLLKQRPGEMLRRLHHAVLTFGVPAAEAFRDVLPELTVTQLVTIRRYLKTVNDRFFRAFPPRGNWSRLQVVDNSLARELPGDVIGMLDGAIAEELRARLSAVVATADVDPRLEKVKLPTSGTDLLPYGRGTAFPLPDSATFVRTASYWRSGQTSRNIWYDNGWNFFDSNWQELAACCWNSTRFGDAAIFSGDPTNVKDAQGRACQLIDLYPEKLKALGVRYAVWSLLCYSRVTFEKAEEVFGLLQWGADARKGRLVDPARAQLAFPVTGSSYTKFVAWLDVEDREVVFIDANLKASVTSAAANGARLSKVMPAFAEYLGALPTVRDLLSPLDEGGDLVARYDDAGEDLTGRSAYVFRPTSEKGDFTPFSLTQLLEA